MTSRLVAVPLGIVRALPWLKPLTSTTTFYFRRRIDWCVLRAQELRCWTELHGRIAVWNERHQPDGAYAHGAVSLADDGSANALDAREQPLKFRRPKENHAPASRIFDVTFYVTQFKSYFRHIWRVFMECL